MRLGLGLRLNTLGLLNSSAFPAYLFTNGEQGIALDPSDLTTMFQDTAGTIPVTTPGQSVARINDKSGWGNHATQATASSRPTYGVEPITGRRNIFMFTEQLDNVAWTKNGSTVTADGADWRLIPTATTSTHGLSGNVASNAGVVHTISFDVQVGYQRWARLALVNEADRVDAWFDLVNFTKGSFTTSASMTYVDHTITSLGDGWSRITLSAIPVNAGGTVVTWLMRLAQANLDVGAWLADGTSFNRIDRPQLELGSVATAYQRVITAFDVTESGVPSVSYLSFDGVDDSLVTPTITPGTDKVQVFAGVRKLRDTPTGIFLEYGPNTSLNNGSFLLAQISGSPSSWQFLSRGTSIGGSGAMTLPLNVLTCLGDISGDISAFRRNGALVLTSSENQGTGNYGNYPLFIGRRGGVNTPFNGQIYSLIVRFGANLTAAQITETESWVNSKTRAY